MLVQSGSVLLMLQAAILEELASLGLEEFVQDYQHALPPEQSAPVAEPEPQEAAAAPEPVHVIESETYVPEPEPLRRRLPKMKLPPMSVNPADLRNGAVLPPPGLEPGLKPQRTQPIPEPIPEPIIERDDVPPPGWELDQLADDAVGEDDAVGSADDAVMTATYGLAPPPAPRAVPGGASEHDLEELLEAVRRHGAHEDQEQN